MPSTWNEPPKSWPSRACTATRDRRRRPFRSSLKAGQNYSVALETKSFTRPIGTIMRTRFAKANAGRADGYRNGLEFGVSRFELREPELVIWGLAARSLAVWTRI